VSLPDGSQRFASRVEGCDGEWPASPEWLSYSSFRELEACPRRWMLRRASYPQVWERSGYPEMPFVASLLGDVVHQTLQRVLVALVQNRCESAASASAVATLKALGGYTAILTSVLAERLDDLDDNPRLQHRRDAIERTLRERLPEMRERVQATLSRAELTPRGLDGTASGEGRGPLPDGSYAELELRASDLRWAGRADLVTIEGSKVQITDYKTGTAEPHHAEQLRLYALLWARDTERNPTGRLASRLVLSYPSDEGHVPPPGEDELTTLAENLARRKDQVLESLSVRPPPARPDADLCSHCPVRHLCEDYWAFIDGAASLPNEAMPAFVDAEGVVTHRNGPRSWMCDVQHPSRLQDRKVVIRTPEEVEFRPGRAIRILSAIAEEDEDHDLLSLTLTSTSEVFELKDR
jgi:hypothetical protein